MSIKNPKNTVILVWNLIIMVAWKASLFAVLSFLGSTALILLQLDNAFTEQQHYAPEIARLTALPDEVWQNQGTYFYRLCYSYNIKHIAKRTSIIFFSFCIM